MAFNGLVKNLSRCSLILVKWNILHFYHWVNLHTYVCMSKYFYKVFNKKCFYLSIWTSSLIYFLKKICGALADKKLVVHHEDTKKALSKNFTFLKTKVINISYYSRLSTCKNYIYSYKHIIGYFPGTAIHVCICMLSALNSFALSSLLGHHEMLAIFLLHLAQVFSSYIRIYVCRYTNM